MPVLRIFTLFFFLLWVIPVNSVTPAADEPLKDYLRVPGPLNFNNNTYNLVWTTRTGHNYYRQQYLPPGKSMKNFDSFLMLEVVKGKATPREQMNNQTKHVRERKQYDPLAKHELFDKLKPGEYILEFMSSETIKGETTYIEWNMYRYISLKDITGKSGVLIVGYHNHARGKYIDGFSNNVQRDRMELIRKLSEWEVPKITL